MANTNFQVSFTSISRFDYRRSSTGATNGVLQYQIGAGAFADITNLNYVVFSSGGGSIGAIDLSGFAPLQNIGAGTNVTFRIVNYLGTDPGGTWYIFDKAVSSALDLAVQGTVTQVLSPGVPALAPAISLVGFTNQQFQFTVSGTPGSNYVVEASTSLYPPVWISLATNAAPFTFIESILFPQRFYRCLVRP